MFDGGKDMEYRTAESFGIHEVICTKTRKQWQNSWRQILLVALGALLIFTGCRPHTQKREGRSSEGPNEEVQKFKLGSEKWRIGLEGSKHGLAAEGGLVYLKYWDEKDGVIRALDAETGETKWEYKVDAEIVSNPIVADGKVYFGVSGLIYALDAVTGQEKWRFLAFGFLYPDITDGVVFVTSVLQSIGLNSRPQRTFYALDANTGKEKWRFEPGENLNGHAVASGVLYFAKEQKIVALDANTGEQKWELSMDKDGAVMAASEAAVIFQESNSSNIYAVDASTQKKLWSTSDLHTTELSEIVLIDGLMYISHSKGVNDPWYLTAVDAETGTKKWTYQQGEGIESFVVADGVVCLWGATTRSALSKHGYFYVLDAETGEERWRFEEKFSKELSSFAVAGEKIFLTSWDKEFLLAIGPP